MTTSDDLISAANLCDYVADAATTRLVALGPRPADSVAAATWDQKDSTLKRNIGELDNLSAQISALVVTNALDQIWPSLTGLSNVTKSAEADINAIADISKAMTKVAAVIDFGVAVAALAAAPSPGGVQNVVAAFNKMTGN